MPVRPVLRPVLRPALRRVFEPSGTPLWLRLIREAEQAAAAAGASLWYVPPERYADTVTVNSDGTGGRPAFGTGVVGRVLSRGTAGNPATQPTSANRPIVVAAPGAAAAAAGFGALRFDGTNDFLSIASGLTDANTFTVVGSAILTSSIPEGQLYTQRDPAAANPIIGQLDFTNGRVRAVSRGTTGTPVELIQTPSQAYVNTPVVATSRNSAARAIRELRVNGALEASKGLVSVSAITPNATIGATLSQTQSYFVGSIGMIARMPIDAPAVILEPIERLGAFIVGAPYPGL